MMYLTVYPVSSAQNRTIHSLHKPLSSDYRLLVLQYLLSSLFLSLSPQPFILGLQYVNVYSLLGVISSHVVSGDVLRQNANSMWNSSSNLQFLACSSDHIYSQVCCATVKPLCDTTIRHFTFTACVNHGVSGTHFEMLCHICSEGEIKCQCINLQ